MTHEDLFQEYLTSDRGRIADWATWLAETEAAIERRLENALGPQAHALHGEPVYLNGEVVDVNGAEVHPEHLGDCVDAVCSGRAVDDPLALADDGWTDDEELRPFEPAATDEGVRRYELVIGEFVQAERETIATGDGHSIVLEPGTYPVLTVTSRAVADRIDAAAIAVHATNERGDREQILIPATAERLRAYVQAGALRLDVPESLLEPQERQEFDVKQYPGFIFSGPTRNPAVVDLSVLRRSGSTPTVIATERDDNPGISITNGAEQLAAQVLTRVVPERAGDTEPFRLVVHHRSASFAVGDRDFEALEATFHEVRFADFQVRENGNGVPRIGDAVEWRNLDERIAEALSEQETLERSADDGRDAQVQRRSRGLHL